MKTTVNSDRAKQAREVAEQIDDLFGAWQTEVPTIAQIAGMVEQALTAEHNASVRRPRELCDKFIAERKAAGKGTSCLEAVRSALAKGSE